MVNIHLETIRMINTFRSLIHNTPLDEIQWWEHGKKLDIDPKTVSKFMETGLNNTDFINSCFYLRTYEEDV